VGFSIVPSTGLNASGSYDAEINFSLQQTLVNFGGTLFSTVTNPGYTEILNLFQEYRIDEVEISFMYSNNTSQINNVSNLPNFLIAADYTDSAAITAPAIMQFENLRVVQLGNYRGDSGPTFKLKPKYLDGALVVGQNAGWLSVLQPTAVHYGLKFVYDPVSNASNVSVGNLSLYVRYHITARKSN